MSSTQTGTRRQILHSSQREGKISQSNPKINENARAQLPTTGFSSTGNELQGAGSSLQVGVTHAKTFSPHLQPECLVAALECIAAELRTVRRECEDPEDVIGQAEEFLSDTIQNRKDAAKGKVSAAAGGLRETPTRRWS